MQKVVQAAMTAYGATEQAVFLAIIERPNFCTGYVNHARSALHAIATQYVWLRRMGWSQREANVLAPFVNDMAELAWKVRDLRRHCCALAATIAAFEQTHGFSVTDVKGSMHKRVPEPEGVPANLPASEMFRDVSRLMPQTCELIAAVRGHFVILRHSAHQLCPDYFGLPTFEQARPLNRRAAVAA